jgi:hypothetical protein
MIPTTLGREKIHYSLFIDLKTGKMPLPHEATATFPKKQSRAKISDLLRRHKAARTSTQVLSPSFKCQK